jgi:translation elongation factor EF-Tu-like GTPase
MSFGNSARKRFLAQMHNESIGNTSITNTDVKRSMAAEKMRGIFINVGTIGHVDHGKTTISTTIESLMRQRHK